jgi:hypothetical protein
VSIASYSFSEKGIMHIENELPCQDSSDVMSYGLWRVAIVADGVGSCKHSDEASKIAVKSALKTVYNCFPNNCKEEDLLSLITMAFHCAANAIEMHVKKVNGEAKEYHTTLAMALYDGKNLYFGNAGDSGIIALDDFGDYHVVTSQQNNEYGEVITLASRTFVVGKVDFNAIAVMCMTDGVFEWVVPKTKNNGSEKSVYVPRANLFIQPKLWDYKQEMPDDLSESLKEHIKKAFKHITDTIASNDNNQALLQVYGSLDEGNLRDDISVSAIINYGADISSEDIKWTPPAEPTVEEMYCRKWEEILKVYPSVAKNEFLSYISKNNTSWTREEVEAYAEYIWRITVTDEIKSNNHPDSANQKHETPEVEKSVDFSKAENDTTANSLSDSLSKSKSKKKQGKHLQWVKNGIRSFLEIEDSEKAEDANNTED